MLLTLPFICLILCCEFANLASSEPKKEIGNNDRHLVPKIYKSTVNITSSERKAIDELRTLMGSRLYKDFMKSDLYLLHWLKNQDMNVHRAKMKLAENLKWRLENKVDELNVGDYAKILRLCPFDTSGHDRKGRPIVSAQVGTCQFRRISLIGDIELFRKTVFSVVETVASELHANFLHNGNVTESLFIGSAFGLSLREHACVTCLPLMVEFIPIYDRYYPDYFYKFVIVNVPRVFDVIYAIVKPLLSERTRKRLFFYGFNKDDWEPEIRKLVSTDQLLPYFGGTKKLDPKLYRYSNEAAKISSS